jgi:PAS domain S-box-containing protein
MLSIIHDATDHVAAAAALQESEQRWRLLVQHATEAIIVFGLDHNRFIECNALALEMFGLSRKELLQKTPADL